MSLIARYAAVCAWLCLWSAPAFGQQSFVHTRDVNALAEFEGALWVASTGGVERYALPALARTHHLTVAHGLDQLDVLALELSAGQLYARTARSRCKLQTAGAACEPTQASLPVPALHQEAFADARVSAELQTGLGLFVGTRGRGVWLKGKDGPRMLTADGQVCTNHVQALAHFQGELWVGGFRDGLCVQRMGRFVAIATPFRFVNALHAAHGKLFVAANEGLFESADGLTFTRVLAVRERGVNAVASNADELLVTTPSALHRLPRGRGKRSVLRTPGGSVAIQAVSVHQGDVWLASEDRGALRVRGGEVTPFDALSGLDASWVVDVAIDRQGTAYAATLKDGLFEIARDGRIKKLALESEWLLKLVWARDRLWVGSQDGLLVDPAQREPPPPLALRGTCVHAVVAVDDDLWVGTESGLFVLPLAAEGALHAPRGGST
jgi:ligand-binding sensor domain-containing protein